MRKKLIQVAVEVLREVIVNLCSGGLLFVEGGLKSVKLIFDGSIEVSRGRGLS